MTSLMKIYSKAARKGSDPRLQTCRGKLQNTRSKLNLEINRELMLRAGAENLLHVSTNKSMRQQVAMELEFFNSNLNLLKERLAELNSSVEIYQPRGSRTNIPLIPLGLKETKEIDFRKPFKAFIAAHYHEDADAYDDAISEFMDLREAMRTPERDESGISLLFEYFNQLYFIDRRFFPPDRVPGLFFEWYDSLTGVPSCQRTVAFEKACVLYNLGGLYTQLGARHDRSSVEGLEASVNCLLRASGVFRYLLSTFTNAPSKDLSPDMLTGLIKLMLAQARECLHEKAVLEGDESPEFLLELGGEAAFVALEYNQVHAALTLVKDNLPISWVTLVLIKRHFYKAKAHQYLAEALLWFPTDSSPKDEDSLVSPRCQELLLQLQAPPDPLDPTSVDSSVPETFDQCTYLGLCHGREASVQFDECLRQQRMCRELRGRSLLTQVLKENSKNLQDVLETFESNFDMLLDPPAVIGSTKVQLSLLPPDFSQHRVEDSFHRLGPVSHFSARRKWGRPREVVLIRSQKQGFGFSVRGDAPVCIAAVDEESVAESVGMLEGDLVTHIGGADVKWLPHDRAVAIIRESGNRLHLTLVTMATGALNAYKSRSLKELSSGSIASSGSSSGVGSTRSSSTATPNSMHANSTLSGSSKRNSWNPFKKTFSRDRIFRATSVADLNTLAER